MRALDAGHHVMIDRTNIDRRQRADWLQLVAAYRARGRSVRCTLVWLDVPYELCRARLTKRRDHPTLPDPAKAVRYVVR